MHLLPAVETPTLTHGANAARAHVMDVVEEHLIPAVATAQAEGHKRMQHRPSAIRVRCEEVVPQMRVVEICDEEPRGGETEAAWEIGPQHETPSLAEG